MPHCKLLVLVGAVFSALCLGFSGYMEGNNIFSFNDDLLALKKSVNYQQPANEICSAITLSQSQVDSLMMREGSLMMFGAEKITLACQYLA